ncbi:MAG: guanylate kinase [Acidimicrobiaceae bacterium]|nr:guanylate kinase [Acidimicrobiaceae bacterium]MBT5205668.1 guanylate kinase [Acidimicrobiaceae bacterium]MBT5568767.1 guanylate kinase [Acidimicrobiaceae bacterium]MBT6091721.1 guanylate kinase [Acidimicrobiaceae bacterium]
MGDAIRHRSAVVIVLSGPGGAGKGTIARALVKRDEGLVLSRSWTTRPRRVDDDADAYSFVDSAAFEARRSDGGFVEWNEFLGFMYGTPTPDPEEGRDLLLEIDVAGGRQVRDRLPGALFLFVDVPDDVELRSRLLGRGDDAERADARVAEAARERLEADDLGYRRVLNDDLETTVDLVAGLIRDHRASNG